MKAVAATALALFGGAVWANPQPDQLNLTKGVTTWSGEPYFLNNVAFGVCVVIGIVVFGAVPGSTQAQALSGIR